MSGGNSHQRAVAAAKKKSAPPAPGAPPPTLPPSPAEPSQQPTPTTEPWRTRLDRWFRYLTRLKKSEVVLAALSLWGFIRFVDDVVKFGAGKWENFSEKLKIEETIGVFHEPWFYVLPTGNAQPIPMWTWFYLTLQNRESRNIWINDYVASAHVKDRDRWIQLVPAPVDVAFRMFPNQPTTLKRQHEFNYNAESGPIAPDGYLRGWVFFETCLAENVDKIELEFHDKEGKTHRVHAGAGNILFGGQPNQAVTPSSITYLGGPMGGSHPLELDNPPSLQGEAANRQWALSPSVEAYVRRIRPYVSLFPAVYQESLHPGQLSADGHINVESCSKWTP